MERRERTPWKRIVPAFVFTILTAGSAAAACKAPDPPHVVMNWTYSAIKYHYDKDVLARSGGDAIGLTEPDLRASSSGKFGRMGKSCFTIAEIIINLKLSQDVYIHNEFAKGSCMFKEVMEHENRHVTIHKNMLKVVSPKMVAMFKKANGDSEPRTFDSREKAQAFFTAQSRSLSQFASSEAHRTSVRIDHGDSREKDVADMRRCEKVDAKNGGKNHRPKYTARVNGKKTVK